MTMPARQKPTPPRPKVDAARLWSGGIATAVVAGLVALVGVLACRWLFGIPILAPQRAGAYGDARTTGVVLAAAAAAVIATAIAHLLLLSTPRPTAFLSWIIGLATVVAVLFPFSTTAPLSQKAATAVVSLAIGIAIGSLLTSVAARSIRPRSEVNDYPAGTSGYPPGRPGYPAGNDGYPGNPGDYPTEPGDYSAWPRQNPRTRPY